MADAPATRLGLADQALINICGMLVCSNVVRGDAEERAWLDSLSEILPAVNRGLPAIDDLAGAARVLMDVRLQPTSPSGAYASATWDLRKVLHGIFRHRAAGALDALRAEVIA